MDDAKYRRFNRLAIEVLTAHIGRSSDDRGLLFDRIDAIISEGDSYRVVTGLANVGMMLTVRLSQAMGGRGTQEECLAILQAIARDET